MTATARSASSLSKIDGHHRARTFGPAFALVVAAMTAFPLCPAAAVSPVEVSPDVSVSLGGTNVSDEDVVEDDLAGSVNRIDLRNLPSAADIDAYSVASNGDMLVSFETTVTLPGGPVASPADVVRYDGFNYMLEFDGSARGVPAGAVLDALAVAGADLLLSFDITVTLDGVTAFDEDLVRFDGTNFTLEFDGSAAGVPERLDLDAADVLDTSGHLILSFDTSGTVGGLTFDDEDILEFDPAGGGTWRARIYDGSAQHPGWLQADLDAVFAVPEPMNGGMQITALAALALVAAARRGVIRPRPSGRPTGGSAFCHPARTAAVLLQRAER